MDRANDINVATKENASPLTLISRGPPVIPDHEMVRCIGQGSYGQVWLARNAVGTWRAVKVVYRDHFQDAKPYEREFSGIQKYEPISRSNEGLVDVLQIGRNDAEGYFYYVMELADDAGESLAGAEGGLQIENVQEGKAHSLHLRSSILNPQRYVAKTLSHELRRRGRLSYEECITLGLTLNLALGHLHRSGLIHRDVKPSNIIFVNGVAKLADIGLVAELAEANSFVGTEGFIPPEGPNSPQADIYALGKVLYEASMGKDRQEFPEPLTALDAGPDSRALLELNAVLLKACEPKPKDRYASAEEMNADLALLHSGRSVRDKHALERRLKITTRVAVAVVAVMVLGVVPYYWAIKEAHRATLAANKAVTEAVKSRQVADFLKQMLQSVEPSVALGQDTTMLKGILDKTAERVGKDLKDQPEVQTELLSTIGTTYFELGEAQKAIGIHREALRLRREFFGETNLLVAESLGWLGSALEMANDYSNAESVLRQALDIRRQLLGDGHPEVARSFGALGTVLAQEGKFQEAEAAHREALALLRRQFPEGGTAVGEALENLGETLRMRKKFAEAEEIDRKALELWRKLSGNENPEVATALTRLGMLLVNQERIDEAEPLLREGYRQRRKFLGIEHPYIYTTLNNYADSLHLQGKFAEAEQLLREHLSLRQKKEDSVGIRRSLELLTTSFLGEGKLDQAESARRDELAMRQRLLLAPNDRSDATLNEAAWFLAICDEPTIRDGLRAVELAEEAVAATNRKSANFLDTLAAAYAETGQFDKAIMVQEEALGLLQEQKQKRDFASRLKLYAANKPYHQPGFKEVAAGSLLKIVSNLLGRGKFAEAEVPARASLVLRELEWPDDWHTFNSRSQLGGSLLGQKKYAEAEPLLLSGYEGMSHREEKIAAKDKAFLSQALQRLVEFCTGSNRPAETAQWREKLDEFNKAQHDLLESRKAEPIRTGP